MQTSGVSESDKPAAGWRDLIISLLKANHVWEAHTLFTIYIDHEGPHDQAELCQILEAIPSDLDPIYGPLDEAKLRQTPDDVRIPGSLDPIHRPQDEAKLRQTPDNVRIAGHLDTMYQLVEMSMLSECLRCVDLPSDKTGYWSHALEVTLKDGSSTMDSTQYLIETSSAYQALKLFAAEQQKTRDIDLPEQMLDSAMENGNFMFALAICARHAIDLPENWTAQTGADIKAITYWHRGSKDPRPSFPTGEVLLNVESYPTAKSKHSHDPTRALRITVSHSTAKSVQIRLRAVKRTMQRPVLAVIAFALNGVSRAANACNRLVPGFFGEVIKPMSRAASGTLDSDYGNLATLRNSFQRITQKAILVLVTAILKISVGAMIGYLGPVDSIWKTIIDNPVSQELFEVLEKNWWVAARFFVDLLEPAKRFASAGSLDGDPSYEAKTWNAHNELDLSQAMNRHAVLCQVQRFLISILNVLRQKDLSVGQFLMDTRLETDTTGLVVTRMVLKRQDDKVRPADSWIFVNGIGGEAYWNHLAVSKIQDFFFDVDNPDDHSEDASARRTVIKSVFSRSDGILWDMLECVSERRSENTVVRKRLDTSYGVPLSSRTSSSREAQAALSHTLRSALSDSKSSQKDIVVIAHSQGCLLLRLALEEIFSDVQEDFRDVMRSHLHVYTFGNPAYDWDVHAYTAGTEHFANELDFVAKLGVLRRFSSDPAESVRNDLTYCSRCRAGDEKHLPKQRIFVNNKRQSGHLFGSQYSLQQRDYDCVNGGSSSALLSRSERRSG